MHLPPASNTHEWIDPLPLARQLTAGGGAFVFLYSARRTAASGRYSFLALNPAQTPISSQFEALYPMLSHAQNAPNGVIFGYLGYGLKHSIEHLPPDTPSYIALPDLWFARFHTVLVFDHDAKTLSVHGKPIVEWPEIPTPAEAPPEVISLTSNMTKAAYLERITRLLDAIHRGALYQMNLTRKFTGHFRDTPDRFALFARLCTASPSPYAALIHFDGNTILSSSPECFLRIDANGKITTQPIKGSIRRGNDAEEDAALIHSLRTSEKERAENLMIVDLMRNDLARTAVAGSVKVDALYEIQSYATVHHLVSTVSAERRPECSTLEVIRSAFPPGSMTGTPKIEAIKLATELEGMARGAYSGALGWMGGDGSCDLSVIIRTLIMQGNQFEFQVGGGIVSDSDPESEWRETILKAKAICAALGIDVAALEQI